MNLIEFIHKRGQHTLAEELGVDYTTVQKWATCISAPQFDNAYKLKLISKGQLNFNSIYGPYSEAVHNRQLKKSAQLHL